MKRFAGMKQLPRILIVMIFAAMPALAIAAGGGKQVWVNNCTRAHFKPKKIVLACGDGNQYLTNLKWSRWSSKSAAGTGKLHQNDCTPSCASGHFKTYKVSMVLSKPSSCTGQKHKVFKAVKLNFGKKRPAGKRHERIQLGCPTK